VFDKKDIFIRSKIMNSLWDILSVAIGVSFIFMILSILNSWIQDYIATLFNMRANNLADVLQNLLEPGAQKLNGIERANTAFKTDDKTEKGLILQLLRGGLDRFKKSERLNKIGETLDKLTDSTEKAHQWTAPIEQLGSQRKAAAGIADLLSDNPVRTLYMHPVVYSLSKPNELPDYLPTKDFTVALLDLLDDAGRDEGGKQKPSEKLSMTNIKKGIEKLEEISLEKLKEKGSKDLETIDNQLGYRLRSLLYTAQINAKDKAQAGIEEFQNAVSEWFDDTVARGSVWYKRRMQRIGVVCGLLLAVVLNADTIGLSNALWHNAMLRESISQAAQASANQGQPATGEQSQQQLEQLMNLGLPIGWSFDVDPNNPRAFPSTAGGWISKSIGLLLTGFAISQGSQIWFDLMNRLLNLRSSGLQPASEEHPAKEKK
jgi:hypothetical protein